MWINRIDDRKGARHQRFDWSWRLDNNVDNATIISYCHIVRSNDNNRWMWGKIKQTPTQQSKIHVVVRKMRRQPYRAMRGSAAQICQGWVQWVHQRSPASTPRTACTLPKSCMLPKASTLSTPKMACTLPIASTVSMPYGMYLAQGKYGKYVKGELIPMEQWQCHPMQQQYWSAKLTILSFATIRLFHCRWALRVSNSDHK